MAKSPNTGSVISKEYQATHEMDEFSEKVSSYVRGADGRVDVERLVTLAEANGCWDPSYSERNVGMQRMNVGNRLRAIARRGDKVVWPK